MQWRSVIMLLILADHAGTPFTWAQDSKTAGDSKASNISKASKVSEPSEDDIDEQEPIDNEPVSEIEEGQELSEVSDLNRDGFPEVRNLFIIKDGVKIPSRKEIDFNSDGKFDIVKYYKDGRLLRVVLDLDLDGRADVVENYRFDAKKQQSVLVSKDTDLGMDGKVDIRKFYVTDQLYKKETDRDGDGVPDRFDYYSHLRLVRSEFDDDADGVTDRWGVADEKSRFAYVNKDEEDRLLRWIDSQTKAPQIKPYVMPTVKLRPEKPRIPAGKHRKTIPRLNVP